MDPNKEDIEYLELSADENTAGNMSVDDFFRELEAKEKDLHITSDTTIIEIAESFDDTQAVAERPNNPKTDELKAEANKAAKKAAEAEANLKSKIAELQDDASELRSRIVKMEEERREIFKNSQRRAKDFENYKARTERERTSNIKNQAGDLTAKLLPALDNLSRALDFAEKELAGRSPEFKQFYDGIYMVNEQIYAVFAEMGVHAIPAVGEVFDPTKHEAVAVEETDRFPENTICEEMIRGFQIGGQIIRHSLVKVAKPVESRTNAAALSTEHIKTEAEPEVAKMPLINDDSEHDDGEGMEAVSAPIELNGFELETFEVEDVSIDDDGETDIEFQISRFE